MKSVLLKILVVEDEAANKMVAEKMLGLLGFSPDFASHGDEAVSAAKASRYDVILMDLQMPILDGFAATRAIREWEKEQAASHKPIKIVAFTGNVTEEVRRRCAEIGMDEFIGKPTSLEKLREVLQQMVEAKS